MLELGQQKGEIKVKLIRRWEGPGYFDPDIIKTSPQSSYQVRSVTRMKSVRIKPAVSDWCLLSSEAGANSVIESGRGKCDTPVMISSPLSRCHAVSRITWHESGGWNYLYVTGCQSENLLTSWTSGTQRMAVSGASSGSPDSRPSSVYADTNKSHSSRYESKFHSRSNIWLGIIKIDKCGHLVQFKVFLCVNSIVSVHQWAKLAAIYSKYKTFVGLLWSPGCLTLFQALAMLMTILMLSLMFAVVGCEALNKMLNISSSMSSSSASYSKYNSLDRYHNGVKHPERHGNNV